MDWYDHLYDTALTSLSQMFDPNYQAVQAATMKYPSTYSDSNPRSLQDIFAEKYPELNHRYLYEVEENPWKINNDPVIPMNKVNKNRVPTEGTWIRKYPGGSEV